MFFGRYFGICIYILPDSLPIQYSRLDELCVKSLSACLDWNIQLTSITVQTIPNAQSNTE